MTLEMKADPDRGGAVWCADPGLLDALEAAPLDGLDDFGFGLIVMDRSGRGIGYHPAESQLAALPGPEVIGRNFFVEVGPCTNNYLVAQHYQDQASEQGELDQQLDYVFTYRMGPTPVRLRLLAQKGSSRQYLAVELR